LYHLAALELIALSPNYFESHVFAIRYNPHKLIHMVCCFWEFALPSSSLFLGQV
jgi:hypothetical protein